MEAAKQFTTYSDRDWAAIEREIKRIKRVSKRPADKITVERRGWTGSAVGLRSELERLGQEYCRPKPRKQTPIEHHKSLKAKRKHAIVFRREVVERGGLPSALRKRAAAILSAIDRLHASHLKDLEGQTVSQSDQNAAKHYLDEYFEALLDLWIEIGGQLFEDRGALVRFVQVCAQPVVGLKSTDRPTISMRLRRKLGY
jgi:hypothetical protein